MGSSNLNDWDIECVRAYADNSMNGAAAAKQLYMHANTMDYRLDKAKKLTGLDPRNFYDLIKLLKMLGEEV